MYSLKAVLLIFLFGYTSGQSITSSFRLPTYLYPEHYELVLSPLFGDRSFSGTVDITIKSAEQVPISDTINNIELHSLELNIDDYEATVKKGTENIKINSISEVIDYEKIIITLEQPIEANSTYYVHLAFSQEFNNDDIGGLLLKSYVNEKNETSEYVIFNMYPIYARRAFPCFDEPHLKATFNITVARPNDMKSISTMPLLKSTPGNNELGQITWDIFEETPKMSTSSLALYVSKVEQVDNSTTNITVWAPTLEEAKIISAMPHWAHILIDSQTITFSQYLLPRLNYVFIPNLCLDVFESWGVIYIRSNDLEERLNPESQKGSVVSNSIRGTDALLVKISKHVLAQYFGDTVTPDWWTDIWLKEATTQYYAYFLVSRIDRSWVFHEFMSGILRSIVLEGEGQDLDLYPIVSKEINNSSELIESLSRKRNLKGALLLYMLSNTLSYPIFSKGLFNFFKTHTLQTVTTAELVQEWQDGLDFYNVTYNYNFTIAEIIQPWLSLKSVPILNVTSREGPGNLTLMISQVVYCDTCSVDSISSVANETSNNTWVDWFIPLTYTSSSDLDFTMKRAEVWLGPHLARNRTHHTVTLTDAAKEEDWVLFNIGPAGLFRTNYDTRNWELIDSQLKENLTEIPLLNRIQIVDDSLKLAHKGKVYYANALEITKYLENETSFYPWHSTFEAFEQLDLKLYENKRLYNPFKAYATNLVKFIYNELDFEGKLKEEYLTILLRAETIRWACYYNVNNCLGRAAASLQAFLNSNATLIREEYKETVFCGGLVEATDVTWNAVYSLYKSLTDTEDRKLYLSALGCTKNVQIIDKYLNEILSGAFTPDDAVNALHGIYKQKEHTEKALDFVKENAVKFNNMYGNDTFVIILNGLASYLTTEKQAQKLLDITSELEIDETTTTSLNTTVKSTLNWIDAFSLEFELYFNGLSNSTVAPGQDTTKHPVTNPNITTSAPETTASSSNSTAKPGSGAIRVASSFLIIPFVTLIFLLLLK